jgi:hypothetical protein
MLLTSPSGWADGKAPDSPEAMATFCANKQKQAIKGLQHIGATYQIKSVQHKSNSIKLNHTQICLLSLSGGPTHISGL